MGGGASSMQHRLHKLSADSVQQLVEGIGPSFVEIAKQLRENGLDGEYLESASDEDLKEIFDDLKVPKIKQKLLRQKLAKLKDVTSSTGSLDTRTDGSGRAMGSSTLSPMVRQIAADDVVLEPEPIGEGGFSIVFRGTWNQQGTFGRAMTRSRRIAAKRSRVAGLGAEIQNDMVRELAVMADFPHQNVLIVHGVSEISGAGIHVITELMAYDLDDVIHQNKRGPLVHQDILHVARDVAAGLAHLHANRIMHRDLKPSNVSVAEGSGIIRCKIADFGISKALTHTLTKMTCKQGTCSYMAPEMLSDDGRVGTSADAYAYGVLAWELLSGKKPWTGKSEHQIHHALVQGERLPRPATPVVPELADWAVECFGVAAERPTMRVLEQALDDLLCSDESDLEMLRAGLADALRGDKDVYEEAWDKYARDPHCGEMLDLCALLAKRHAETPRQPESCRVVEDLLGLAERVRDDFHDTISGLVKSAGGEYKRGPTKLRERCVEKASREYDGDVCRVVDVERATALFTTVSALHEGLRQLSRKGGSDLEVVRVKDSFGEPKPSGWRCVYFSLRHAASGLVGELQVTFDKIKAINGRSHRIYNLVRCMERGVEPAARTAQVAEETRRAAAKASKAPEDPLLAATKAGDADAIARLLDGGAAVDQTRGDGETLLWTVSFEGHVNAGRLLLDRGASADHGDDYGQTPLWVACFKGRVEMTRLLLAHGADASRATKKGTTPLGIAQKQGHWSIVALLEKHLRDTKSPAAWYSEGIARRDEKKWPEAIKAFQNCVALDANHSEAWYELGNAYFKQNGMKHCEASIKPYQRCVALDASNAQAHYMLGSNLYNLRKDYDGAERHYQKAVELDPTAIRCNGLGNLLVERKDYDGAEKMFRKAIELNPKHTYARWNVSFILDEQKNDIPGAVKQMEEFVNLGGNSVSDGKQRLAKLRAKL